MKSAVLDLTAIVNVLNVDRDTLAARLLGLLCLKLPPAISGGMTKIPEGCESRLARIINSTEERKIRKWIPLPSAAD